MQATIETLSQRLASGPYVRRYDCKDDQGYLSAGFLLCSFWYVDSLIFMNRLDAAERMLAQLIELSSPLGLLAEGSDPGNGAPRGNFPQAYSHLGIIDSAVRLARARAAAEQESVRQDAEPQQVAG
jgi:GH15 family glucan-1,4-alpha-glucosidase